MFVGGPDERGGGYAEDDGSNVEDNHLTLDVMMLVWMHNIME